MTLGDLDEIMLLERLCFRDPWTRRMYIVDLTENPLATYLVLRYTGAGMWHRGRPGGPEAEATASPSADLAGPTILAYGGFWLLTDEAHIATLATHPDWRGCGLGLRMMVALLDAAVARGAALATLEVRAGNRPAQELYRKLGFEVVGVRRKYYRDGEDGLIMTTPAFSDPDMQARMAAARAEAVSRMTACFAYRHPEVHR